MKIVIHRPVFDGEQLVARYTSENTTYSHVFTFPDTFQIDPAAQRLAEWTVLIHVVYLFSIEYYDELVTEFALSPEEIQFFEHTINNGMAEFRYVNNLAMDLKCSITPISQRDIALDPTSIQTLEGIYVLNGGGKDGLTSGSLLKDAGFDFELFEVGSGVAQRKAAKALGKKSVHFKREMDERRNEGQYRGHRPTNAALAIVSSLTAYLYGKRDIIASNENSANEPNLIVDGVTINHQYSKSYEFEADFTTLMRESNLELRYFSLLRPFHELQIVTLFSHYPQLFTSFVSCNHGFRKGFWCKKCAKCAFINLAFTAVNPHMTEAVFEEPQSINKPLLRSHLQELVLPESVKPLECVGTLEECQIAAKLINNNKDVVLTDELRQVFQDASNHVSEDEVKTFLATINNAHAIPEEYMPIIQKAENILRA